MVAYDGDLRCVIRSGGLILLEFDNALSVLIATTRYITAEDQQIPMMSQHCGDDPANSCGSSIKFRAK